MTGPEHYREAERLLVHTDMSVVDQFGDGAECARQQIAMAQAHATLALTAATAAGGQQEHQTAWDLAIGWWLMSMAIVDIEGPSLTTLRRTLATLTDQLASDHVWKVAVAIDDVDGAFKVKVNDGVWSPPMGVKRP